MLPDDTRSRRQTAAASKPMVQGNLDAHTKPMEAPPAPYSNDLFEDIAIEWATATDQVCA